MIKYKWEEPLVLHMIEEHINNSYELHYSMNRIQSTEFIFDAEHGEGFCIGNIIKYAQRYGKKNGYNREDLKKIVHYAIIMMSIHDSRQDTNHE